MTLAEMGKNRKE